MKNVKKILCMVLALSMVLALCACGSTASSTTTTTTATTDDAAEAEATISTVTPGKLTVATSPDFAPYEFYAIDADGNPTLAGFDLALAQYIADYLGLELEVIPVDFDGVLNELASGNVDLGMAGLSPDPSRMDAMDFSDIYYQGGQSFVTVQSKADQFTSLDDTNKSELTIGAQNGSIQMDLANQYSPDADIVALVKVTDIIAELLGDKLDGAYIETAVAQNYAKTYTDLAVVLDVPYDVAGSAVGVSKGNDSLLAGVNEAIAAALADGSMSKFIAEANELSTGEIYEGLLEDQAG
jgi:polar amino acid transport system substrate-binding protein